MTTSREDFKRRYSGVVIRPLALGRFVPAAIDIYTIEIEAAWSWERPYLPRANSGCTAVRFAAAAFALPGGTV